MHEEASFGALEPDEDDFSGPLAAIVAGDTRQAHLAAIFRSDRRLRAHGIFWPLVTAAAVACLGFWLLWPHGFVEVPNAPRQGAAGAEGLSVTCVDGATKRQVYASAIPVGSTPADLCWPTGQVQMGLVRVPGQIVSISCVDSLGQITALNGRDVCPQDQSVWAR